MKRIFGQAKEKPPPPTLDQATEKLQTRGETIDEKIRKLDDQLVKHREAIKKARPGPAQEAAKRRALQVLKQKRLYESQRDQLYGQQFNVEQSAFVMQNIQDTVHTVSAMKAASKEMKHVMKSNKDLRLENLDKLQDEMADMVDYHNEVQDIMASNYNLPDAIDEDELMGELDALEDEMALEKDTMPAYLMEPDLPEVPTAQPAQAQATDEFGLPNAMAQRT